MSLRLEVSGFDEAKENLHRIAGAVGDDRMREYGIEALEPVAETARSLVPERSGATREGIIVSDKLPGGEDHDYHGKAVFVGVLEGPSFWAGFVELGTVKMRAEPFLMPAVDAEEDRVFDILGHLTGQAILSAT